MSILKQISLNPSDKRHLLLNSLNCQDYGDITQISSEFSVSRKTVYCTREVGLNAQMGYSLPHKMSAK